MESSFWTKRRGVSRRRFLGAGAGAGFSAAFLAACGGSNNNGGAKATTTSNTANTQASVTRAAGTAAPTSAATAAGTARTGTAAAGVTTASVNAPTPGKRGGKMVQQVTAFPSNLDVQFTSDTTSRFNWGSSVYSHLVVNKGVPVPGPDYPSPEVVADLAQSWETPDQGITYTFKINPKAKWQPPISRAVTADDVIFSINRFRGQVSGTKPAVNPEQLDVIDSMSAPDPSTLILKTKASNALFLLRLADDQILQIVPKEIGQAFDPTKTGVGSGPWMVDQLNPPQGFTLKRNPDWHLGPDVPYLDSYEFIGIQDPATTLNQFKAGNLDYPPVVQPKDIPGIKSALPDLVITLGPSGTSEPYVAFSSKDPTSPWNKDPRVRQAFSMSIDRDSLWAAYYPNSDYTSNGLPVPPVQYNNIVPTGLGSEWLAPKGSHIDADVKPFFQYSPDNAKKLLAAAGFPDGVTADYHYTTGYGAPFSQHAELVIQMVAKGGFKLTAKIDDFASVFQPKTFFGDFDGLAQIYQGYGTSMEWIQGLFYPGSSRNPDKLNDPTLTKMIDDMLTVLDVNQRRPKILAIQNYVDKMMYYVPGMLGAGPIININRGYTHNLFSYYTARSGRGYWDAWYWRG